MPQDSAVPSEMIRRRRLERRLDAGTPLTCIHGPLGSGKTTLLRQWISTRAVESSPVIWIDLAREHLSRSEIWSSVTSSVVLAEARARAGSPARTTTDSRSNAAFDRLMSTLESETRPFLLVLDAYCNVSDSQVDEDILNIAARNPAAQIIVATRLDETFTDLSALVRTPVTVINHRELLFTRDEANKLIRKMTLKQAPHGAVSGASIRPIVARMTALAIATGRWPAEDGRTGSERVADSLLQHHLAHEVPADLQDFLLSTSVADSLTPELAQTLSGSEDSALHLAAAHRLSFGSWSEREHIRRFTYDPYLRSALQRQLAESSSERLVALRRLVAVWAHSNDMHVEAFHNALAIQDFYFASEILRTGWVPLTTQDRRSTLAALDGLNSALLGRFPLLSMAFALTLTAAGQHARALPYLDPPSRISHTQGDDATAGEKVWNYSVESVAMRLSGRFKQAAVQAEQVIRLNTHLSNRARLKMGASLSLALSESAMSLHYAGKNAEALDALETAVAAALPHSRQNWFHANCVRAGILAAVGEMKQAREIITQIDDFDHPLEWRGEPFGYMGQIARALIAIDDFDAPGAQRHLDDADMHFNSVEHWPYFVSAQAWLHIVNGNSEYALTLIDAAMRPHAHPPSSAIALASVRYIQVWALLASGHDVSADAAIKQLPKDFSGTRVLFAFRQLQSTDAEGAFITLAIFQHDPRGTINDRYKIIEHLVLASASIQIGKRRRGVTAAKQALWALRENNLWPLLMVMPRADLETIRAALSGADADDLSRFLSERHVGEELITRTGPSIVMSKRELLVLHELSRSNSLTEISESLFVSVNTVKTQLQSLYRKLDVHSREDALIRASESGVLIPFPEQLEPDGDDFIDVVPLEDSSVAR